MEILQVENLSFAYPEQEGCKAENVLKNISFKIEAGEFVVVCGESGCGKSTLLKLLKKEVASYGKKSGNIYFEGVEQAQLTRRKSVADIGLVLQNPDSQIVTDKVWHELAFGLESMGEKTAVIKRRVAELASYFGIEEWFYKNVNELSGGQKQILNLASVMVMQPKILLLDEPTAQLDPIAATNFIQILHKLNTELGITVLLVEHRLEEALAVADRVLIMEKGEVIYDDNVRSIGAFFAKYPKCAMKAAMPAAVRIFEEIRKPCGNPVYPITVKEGRAYIISNYGNKITSMLELNKKSTKNKTYDDKKSSCVLELNNVSFRYERTSKDVLKGMNMKVWEAEHICILGGNGAGKTTMLGVMSGVLSPYRGKVLMSGRDVKKLSVRELYRHNVAVLPQNPQTLFVGNTVQEDLEEVCRAVGYDAQEAKKQVDEVVCLLHIDEKLDMHPYDLSGGEQQKVALAKLLLSEPKLLMLDEPTKGLDAHFKEELTELFVKLKKKGMTVITVTHDVEFAADNADRCALCFDGEIVSYDRPVEFFSNNYFYTTAANRMIAGYYEDAINCSDVVELCHANAGKGGGGDERQKA